MKEYDNPSYMKKTEETQFSYDTELSDQELDAIRLEVPSRREGDIRVMNNVNDRKLKHSLTAAWCVNAEDSSYIAVCCDCLWLIDQLRNLTFVFCRWKMLIHTGQEGPREGQTITQIKTTGGWRCGDGYSTPPGMFSVGRILWPLIGCRPRMVGSAEQTSHIRKDPRVRQAVVAAPVTRSLVISWLYRGNYFLPSEANIWRH